MTPHSRRQFLQTGIAASVLPLGLGGWRLEGGPVGRPASDAESASLPLYKVLFDRRFRPGVTFADAAAALGARTVGFEADITDIWFRDLSLQWAQRPVPVAGLTAHGPLFCLERWGWDHGLRVIYRTRHDRLEGGRTEHTAHGPRTVVSSVREALNAGGSWPRQLARPMTNCPPGETDSIADHLITPGESDIDPDEPLFSWVIAPYRPR
jgi:hypothetical protein